MNGKANFNNRGKKYHNHTCTRHQDLTILMKSAKKEICSTCFATLKKSYFNVIAGLLLGEDYLNNVTRGLIEQDNRIMKQLQDVKGHLVNLSAEITEIKNNGRNHEKPRPETPSAAPSNPEEMVPQHAPSNAQEICTEGHVAKVAHSLQDLLHIKIARILNNWKKTNPANRPK